MDIHGEDSFGLGRENTLLFRHHPHMYFSDFTVPSSKLKDLEDIDALSKHVIMKGMNEDDNTPTPPPSVPLDYSAEPALKLEEEDELGFAFFRKPNSMLPPHMAPSEVDLMHASNGKIHNEFNFMQPAPYNPPSSLSHTNGKHPSSFHDTPSPLPNGKNSDSMGHLNINTLTQYNNININININNIIQQHKPQDMSHLDDEILDDKSAIQLINTNNNPLEFLDDYITTGSSSSPDEDEGDDGDEGMGGGGLGDSTMGLSSALTSSALNSSSSVIASPSLRPPPPLPLSSVFSHSPLSHSTPIPHPALSSPHSSSSSQVNRLHHSTSSLLNPSLAPPLLSPPLSSPPSSSSSSPQEGFSLSSSCGMVVVKEDLNEPTSIVLAPGGTTVIDGVTYNNRGYEVCGSLNKFNKPCQRIGRCPFHHDSSSPKKGEPAPGSSPAPERRYLPIKKGPYKSGWKKDEHIRFLKGLQMHGKGSWKEIALIVGTRTPTQIQVHAHRYYLRQQQETKNKRSIHDISLQDLEDMEAQGPSLSDSTGSSLSPPSPDRSSDLSHLFCSPSTPHHPTSPPAPSPSHSHSHSHSHSLSHSHSHHTNHLTPLSPNPLSRSDSIPPPPSSNSSSPPISAPSSPIVPPLSSSSFPSLFSGISATSNSLPGLPLLSFPLAPYHNSSSWYTASSYNMNQMSNLNSMTINMSGLGDVDLHLPSSSSSFSHMSDDDYEDDLSSSHHPSHHPPSHHPSSHPLSNHHSDPSSPEEEFPSDDE